MSYEPFIQFGALGILAYVVYWLTNRFNGSIKANTDALKANTKAVTGVLHRDEQIHTMLEKRTERFENIEEELHALRKENQQGFTEVADAFGKSSEILLKRLWTLIHRESAAIDRKE